VVPAFPDDIPARRNGDDPTEVTMSDGSAAAACLRRGRGVRRWRQQGRAGARAAAFQGARKPRRGAHAKEARRRWRPAVSMADYSAGTGLAPAGSRLGRSGSTFWAAAN
jgi:hypothetical protein